MSTSATVQQAALAVSGPAALGLCAGLSTGPRLGPILGVPAVVIGVTALMIPALYIATALAGVAPPLGRLARSASEALASFGLIGLGCGPALAFLVITATAASAVEALLGGALLVASAVGLRVLFANAFEGARAGFVFVQWSLVTIGIGAHLLRGVS